MRDGEFATKMQQQEEDEAQKLMEKEQRAMSSTLTAKALILIHRVLSLDHFIQYSIPQNLGVASKVTTLATDSMFFFADRLLHLQAVFRVAGKYHFGRRVALHNLVIARDDMAKYFYEPHRKYHQQSDHNFSGLPTYDIWSLVFILYHLLFGSPFFNFFC